MDRKVFFLVLAPVLLGWSEKVLARVSLKPEIFEQPQEGATEFKNASKIEHSGQESLSKGTFYIC